MNPLEMIAVALGLGVVGVAGSDRAGVDDAAVSALAKIEQLLPARLRARIDELSGAITATSTTAARRAPAVDRRVLAVLARDHRQPPEGRERAVVPR